MGQTEYIVRFKGDYSALAKDLKQIGAATKQIADDEVIIKLHYDGNIKEFNKTFDTISKMHPELGIQFQYNVNEKLLNQELEKLKGITELQLDIDEGKVRDKLQNLGNSVETAFNEGLSKDEITKRVKQFFGYYNTATKAGVKDISKLFYGIRTRIYDALKSDNHISIFDDLIDADEKKSFELFKIDKSLKDDLVDTQNRVNDIKDTLKSLEEKGASKTGLPSELQKVQDEIKILRSDIEEMKGDLKNLSGDAFDAMTQQIKDTNEQLHNALELVKELKTTLSDNGITKNNSVGNVIKQWQKEKETQTNERYTAFNSQSKQTSGAHLAADAEGVSMKLIRSAIDEMGDEADGTIHSHPMKFAAFSDDDIERYFNLFEDTQGKIFSHAVTSAEQAISIDMSKIDTSKKKDILSFIKEEYSNIDNQLIGNIGSKSKELKNTVNTILGKYQNNNELNPQIKELVNNIQQGVDVMFANLGDAFSYEDFADSFDSLLGNSAKQTAKDLGAKTVDDLKSMLQRFMPNIGEIMESVEDAVLIPLNNQAQQAYQNVLQKVFTNPKLLKSGETSAIKIEALSDFIDWGSIEQSAKEASQKAADALQEAQDSNSPAELTKPLGKDFGLGYAEGIREAMPEIVNACKEVVLAAYNAVKETSDAENGEGNDLLDNFINNFKESLNNVFPAIQEKIKEIFSKIDIDNKNEKTPLSSIASEDFQTQLQNTIDETGKYIIRVYGELIDDFKSRLQNSIDETGIYHVDIEGWLYDTFHSRLQDDIDGQERYFIEVNGELIETFKDVVQEAIDNLGAFPIQVKPYVRKGGEIEEVDLPSGNQNNLSSDTLAGKTFDELINVSNIKKGSNELNAALRESMEHLKAMYDAGDTESEEYVGTLYRIINLQKEMWKFNGGKGSSYDNLAKSTKDKGGKDVDVKMDLQDSIYKDFQDFSGTSKEVVDFVLEEFSRLKSDGSLIFDETGKLITASTRQRVQNVIDEVERETEVVRDNIEEQRNIVEQSQSSNKTPVSTESTEAETKALLSKKEVVEQLRTELNLTKKAAEELFNSQGYTSENGRYKIEKDTVDELILSLKKKNELEESSSLSAIPLTDEESEQVILNNLLIMLENIIKKVDEKTRAFREEGQVVEGVVQNELTNLDVLSGYLINLRDEVSKVSAEFQGMDVKINITDTGVDKVTKFVSALSKINDDKIEEKITRVFSSLDDFAIAVNNIKINDNGILSSINNLLSKSKELENLASVLKESKKKIKEATKATKEKNEPKNYASKYNRKLDSLGSKIGDDIGNYRGKGVYAEKYLSQLKEIQGEVSKLKKLDVADEKDIQELEKIEDKIKKIKSEEGVYSGAEKQVNGLIDKVNKLRDSGKYTQTFVSELDAAEGELRSFLRQLKDGGVAFDEIDDKVTVLAKNVEDTLAKKAFADFKQAAEKSLTNLGLKIDQIVAKNSGMGSYFESEFKKLREMSDTAESVGDVQRLVAAINKLESEMINAGKTGKSFIDQIKQRLRDINSKYIAQYFSFQDILRYARQAVTNVIQLNDAFIELSKVSNTALKTLEADFQSYADIAKKIGGTITDTINATADWARMGYGIPDAKELARVALLYKNVGDGIDISTANQSLISTLQGYQMQADEAEHIVDVFNEVANNYAIDTAGIGEALQRSAASLNAANTSLEQSVALVTAANTVVQNPESVGTTFKTLSARIRGAKTDLEELGEEEDEFTETTSKLQGLVKSLTGFDILEADQKTFKSIYDILIGIGDAWKDLDDIERASLGEALAGKFYYQNM